LDFDLGEPDVTAANRIKLAEEVSLRHSQIVSHVFNHEFGDEQ